MPISKFPELYKAAPSCRRDALRLSAGCVYVSTFGIIVDARFLRCVTEFELRFGCSLLVLHSWSEEVVSMFPNSSGSGVILVDIVDL